MNVATGMIVLDDYLGGGIEKHSKLMVYGSENAGKTIACARFVNEGLKKKEKCLFITTKDTPEQIIKKSKKLGIKLDKKKIMFFQVKSSKNVLKKIMKTIYENNIERTVIDTLCKVITLKNLKGMDKYKEMMKQLENLQVALSKTNTCMITADDDNLNRVEMKMCEDFFQTSISLILKKNRRFCTINKCENKPELLNKTFELEEDSTIYEVKKFFE